MPLAPPHSLATGGTAIGTELNAPVSFGDAVCRELAARSGLPVRPASDAFAALAGHEVLVALHGTLKVLAVALMKTANDIRLLGSGSAQWFRRTAAAGQRAGLVDFSAKMSRARGLLPITCL